MSDNILRFIPVDPTWQPLSNRADDAADLLSKWIDSASKIETSFSDEITFFDPGQNWSGVECPNCGVNAESWFWSAFDIAAENGFSDLSVATPCCGAEVSLNTLRYKWPAGFGRFALEALNPGITDTTPEQEEQLATCVGGPLRKIWVHI